MSQAGANLEVVTLQPEATVPDFAARDFNIACAPKFEDQFFRRQSLTGTKSGGCRIETRATCEVSARQPGIDYLRVVSVGTEQSVAADCGDEDKGGDYKTKEKLVPAKSGCLKDGAKPARERPRRKFRVLIGHGCDLDSHK